jgi:ribonuclease III
MPLLREHFGIKRIYTSSYYVSALTHSSFHAAHALVSNTLNERLEFLGDAVLELVVSSYLYERFPTIDEGKLTRCRANIVCRENLNTLANSIQLGNYLRSSLPVKQLSIDALGNAYEALVGAIYLDQGFEKTKCILVEHLLETSLIDWSSLQGELYDYRSLVLHWSQREKKKVEFTYQELSHTPSLFECFIYVDDVVMATAKGRNKKLAGQEACKVLVTHYELS